MTQTPQFGGYIEKQQIDVPESYMDTVKYAAFSLYAEKEDALAVTIYYDKNTWALVYTHPRDYDEYPLRTKMYKIKLVKP